MSNERNVIEILKDLRNIHESESKQLTVATEETKRNIQNTENEISQLESTLEQKKSLLTSLRELTGTSNKKINRIDQLIRMLEFNVNQDEKSIIGCHHKSRAGCEYDVLQSMIQDDDLQTDLIFLPREKRADLYARADPWTGFAIPYEFQKNR